MIVKIPDAVAATLPVEEVDRRTTRAVDLLGAVPLQERVLVLREADLTWLEERLGMAVTTLASAAELCARVDRLAGLSFGHLYLSLPPAHLEELERKALGQGCSVPEVAAKIIQYLLPQILGMPIGTEDAPVIVYLERGDPIPPIVTEQIPA
jgi:hypothetical protein